MVQSVKKEKVAVARNGKNTFDHETMRDIEHFVKGYSEARATDYQTWSEILFAILNIVHTWKLAVPENDVMAWANRQCHRFSKKSGSYSTDGVDHFIDSYHPRASGSMVGFSRLKQRFLEDGGTLRVQAGTHEAMLLAIANQ